jgi:hypothetical protein
MAGPLACPTLNGPAYSIAVPGGGFGNANVTSSNNVTGTSFTCGPDTFSDFAIGNGGGSVASDWSGSISFTLMDGLYAEFSFNPNINPTGSTFDDLELTFEITSSNQFNEMYGYVSGTQGGIEVVIACTGPWSLIVAGGDCNGVGLSGFSANAGQLLGPSASPPWAPTNPTYVFEAFKVYGPGQTMAVTGFSSVLILPEPASVGMMAAGLTRAGCSGSQEDLVDFLQ